MIEFITEAEVEKALNFLRDTAEDYAKWKSRMKYLELHRKSVRAAEFFKGKGSSAVVNKEHAENSTAYREILKEYEEAVYEFTVLDALRSAAETKISTWQTIQASNRKGHI